MEEVEEVLKHLAAGGAWEDRWDTPEKASAAHRRGIHTAEFILDRKPRLTTTPSGSKPPMRTTLSDFRPPSSGLRPPEFPPLVGGGFVLPVRPGSSG